MSFAPLYPKGQTFAGYLSAVTNPQFSGLARIVVRSRRKATKSRPGKFYAFHAEAGSGVRGIVRALGDNGRLTQASGEVRCRWAVDSLGVLSALTIDGEGELNG